MKFISTLFATALIVNANPVLVDTSTTDATIIPVPVNLERYRYDTDYTDKLNALIVAARPKQSKLDVKKYIAEKAPYPYRQDIDGLIGKALLNGNNINKWKEVVKGYWVNYHYRAQLDGLIIKAKNAGQWKDIKLPDCTCPVGQLGCTSCPSKFALTAPTVNLERYGSFNDPYYTAKLDALIIDEPSLRTDSSEKLDVDSYILDPTYRQTTDGLISKALSNGNNINAFLVKIESYQTNAKFKNQIDGLIIKAKNSGDWIDDIVFSNQCYCPRGVPIPCYSNCRSGGGITSGSSFKI